MCSLAPGKRTEGRFWEVLRCRCSSHAQRCLPDQIPVERWFLALLKFEVPTASGRASHQWSRVVARDIFRVIEAVVQKLKQSLNQAALSLLLPARLLVRRVSNRESFLGLRAVFRSSVEGFMRIATLAPALRCCILQNSPRSLVCGRSKGLLRPRIIIECWHVRVWLC